jgi:glycosyltransferase involved in cell wall biosynthesis
MLTANRPELALHAIQCFRAQSYPNKRLLVFDTRGTVEAYYEDFAPPLRTGEGENEYLYQDTGAIGKTIGELRNMAIRQCLQSESQIIIHFDDDDHSHPERIAEQVAFLQQSGAGCVGFNEMLFWRQCMCCAYCSNEAGRLVYRKSVDGFCSECGKDLVDDSESWLYTHPSERYALGSSLAYWRSVWERRPFDNKKHIGEDAAWIKGVDTRGVSANARFIRLGEFDYSAEPRMVCRIHSANTNAHAYTTGEMLANKQHWTRVPDRDEQLRRIMS